MDRDEADLDRDGIPKHLIINIKKIKFTNRELGRGAYGRVFAVNYNGIECAAKEIHPLLLQFGENESQMMRQSFLRECIQHSKLRHPNIVKMLGVYYPNNQAVLPVMVMELMEHSLTKLVECQNISMYVKISILQDVSRAICYLHTLSPPVIHRDLSPNNILLTTSLVAKVSDLQIMKVGSPLSSDRMTRCPGTPDFMPPEALVNVPHYGLPLDVFSFGCVVSYVITQQWPLPSVYEKCDPITKTPLSEVERRSHYIDQISEASLKQLVITCLDNDPGKRPSISLVSERINSIITG